MDSNPYKTVVHGISPVNEPNGVFYAEENNNLNVTQAFYERSYKTLLTAGYPMHFHHGFAPKPAEFWTPFATGKNASMLVINDNPYPGWFPPVNDTNTINQRVCSGVTSYNNFPVPMTKTEFSLVSGPTDPDWNKQYYATQVSAYAAGAGSYFWGFKMLNATEPVKAQPAIHQSQYSFLQQVANGAIPRLGKKQTAEAYIQALPNPACGNLAQTFNP